MKRFLFHLQQKTKGQSLVELAIVFVFLLGLLASVVEVGSALNVYINLIDGARAGARFGSNDDPFTHADPTYPDQIKTAFYEKIATVIEGSIPDGGTIPTGSAMAPIVLDKANGDDIIISFFGISGTEVRRFPNSTGWKKYNNNVETKVSVEDIKKRLVSGGPDTGVLLVEIFYHYRPAISPDNLDEFEMYAYAIMPLSAAEPTPTPLP